jgi:hypothetical protein
MKAEEKALFDKKQAQLESQQFNESLGSFGAGAMIGLETIDMLDPTNPENWIGGAY